MKSKAMSQNVAVKRIKQPAGQVPFLLRVIWFFLLGWELAGVWILIAWAFNATIIGLPIGLWMIDRVPQVLTLRSRPGSWVVDLKNGRSQYRPAQQLPWLIRLPYFLLIGWWVSLIWAAIAWFFCATIIGLPLGVLMLHALPGVTTLQRG
jgi:uncharacterized membrane protein YccF (DUF307 family)